LAATAEKTASNANPSSIFSSFRNLSAGQLAAGGVIAAETLGFFTVGEMIGRMKLIGYHGETAHH
jgi:F-type H+-transporting ATPase subunit g